MSIASASIGPQGLGQSTLELLADPKKLDKTLKSLQEAQDRAQSAIDLAGPASEIVAIRAQVGAELQKQIEVTESAEKLRDEEVAEGEAEAARVIKAAQEEGEGIIAEAQDQRDSVLKEAADAKSEVQLAERELSEKRVVLEKVRQDLNQQASDIKVASAAVDARSAEVEELNSSLLKEKARLAEAREHLSEALG